MQKSMVALYEDRIHESGLTRDAAQAELAKRFDELATSLHNWRPPGKGLLGLFGGRGSPTPNGLYVHGSVGRGKTMLMDLFFDHVSFQPKRRLHFHEFMAETHDRIADARQASKGDPIPVVAEAIAAQSRLLCFDELHVTDIADAMILGRLFKALFADGVVVVATSNAAPHELYKNGLNRNLFVPFIKMIDTQMDVVHLDAAEDYRMLKLAGRPLYFSPADDQARVQMNEIWQSLTGIDQGAPAELAVKGRSVAVPEAANGVARFDFRDLCALPLGANDYLSIARTYHTVMIDNIPVLGPAKRNEARRFINLIDTLYDAKVGLVVSAESDVEAIYKEGDGQFLFERTMSRLIEMRSESYLAARSERLDIDATDETTPTNALTS
ncbi:MAG: cell division protein ZapE [Hyphomicrobiaceae bacterium]|jgi:cell division protein ZapE